MCVEGLGDTVCVGGGGAVLCVHISELGLDELIVCNRRGKLSACMCVREDEGEGGRHDATRKTC